MFPKVFFSAVVLILFASVGLAACGGGAGRAGIFNRRAPVAAVTTSTRTIVRTSSVAPVTRTVIVVPPVQAAPPAPKVKVSVQY